MKTERDELEDLEEESVDELEEDKLDDDFLNDDLMDDFYGEGLQSPIEKHKDLLKDLTNFEIYLKQAHNNWLGITWNEEKGKFTKNPNIKPLMNAHGAAWCSSLLKTYARGNNIITDIGVDEYKYIMQDHINAIWLNLGTREDLGIKSDGDLIRVCNELEHAAALALMGAGDGKYNKFLGSTFSYNMTGRTDPNNPQGNNPIVINNNPKKPGMAGKIKNFLLGES